MIKCIKRVDLEPLKWDQSVRTAYNGRLYGMSHYLDRVCTNGSWLALVYKDYEAVMPLPLNRTIPFFPRITIPIFAQQLGVFSKTAVSSDLVSQFIAAIPNKYKSVYLQLNETNPVHALPNTEIGQRSNFTLLLDRPYEELRKAYSKNLKRSLKVAQKNELQVNTVEVGKFVPFYLTQTKNQLSSKHDLQSILTPLLDDITSKKEATIYGIENGLGDLIAACVITQFQGRLTYLLARSSDEGKEKRAMHFLIDHIIKQSIGTADILDFEGSDIPSVARFFGSFGGVDNPYSFVSYKRFPLNMLNN